MVLRVHVVFFLLSVLVFVNAQDQDATILRQENIIDPDGKYRYGYATSNGIEAEEEGEGGVNAVGFFTYTNPDGESVKVSYVADENGFQPDNAPVAPEIPPLIQKALAYVASNALAKKK